MTSQKDAVFQTVTSVLSKSGRSVDTNVAVELNKVERSEVITILVAGIEANEIFMTDKAKIKYDTTTKKRAYVSGMIGNWLTKDTRFGKASK